MTTKTGWPTKFEYWKRSTPTQVETAPTPPPAPTPETKPKYTRMTKYTRLIRD
jgi:hypothetical protein